MVEKIGHYSITNPASVYDEEAVTALELAARTAAKVNECVGEVNAIPDKIAGEVQQHIESGRFNEQVDKYAGELRQEMAEGFERNDTAIAGALADAQAATAAIASGKVDKNGNGQVTMAMLATEVKAAMTGGSVPVTGANSVNTESIVDGAVTPAKMNNQVHAIAYSDSHACGKPMLIIDRTANTVSVNADIGKFWFFTPHDAKTFYASTCTAYMDSFDSTGGFKIFFNPSTKVFTVSKVASAYSANDYYLGTVPLNLSCCTNIIPIECEGLFIAPSTTTHPAHTANSLLPVATYLHKRNEIAAAFFDIDTTTGVITKLKTEEVPLYAGFKSVTIDFSVVELDYTHVDFTNVGMYVYYDHSKKKLIFQHTATDIPASWYYIGVIFPGTLINSMCLLPFSVNGTHFYNPKGVNRQCGHLVYAPAAYTTKTLPYVDFKNKRMVFPVCNGLYLSDNNSTWKLPYEANTDYVVPFVEDSNYMYLVGSAEGLRFVTSDECRAIQSGFHKDMLFYLGYVVISQESYGFTFEATKGRSLSVLGDSVSTYTGYNPEGNTVYYKGTNGGLTNVKAAWWYRVMNRCGLYLNVNNAYSGARVTNTSSETANAMNMCENLGEAPDVIIMYMGVNDFVNGVELGTYNGRGPVPTDGTTFREALAITLKNMLTKYKTSKVYVCTIPACQRTSADVVNPESNSKGVYLTEYNDAIREICRAFCVEVIDLECCGLNNYNGSEYAGDYNTTSGLFLHPNYKGHQLIAAKIAQSIAPGAD